MRRRWRIGKIVFGAWLVLGSVAFAAAPLEPVTVGYSTFAGAYLPLWSPSKSVSGANTAST